MATSTDAWREIFRTSPAGHPTLGLDARRAAQDVVDVCFAMGSHNILQTGKDPCPQHDGVSGNAVLTLRQDLGNMGLGGVVWKCVSLLSASRASQHRTPRPLHGRCFALGLAGEGQACMNANFLLTKQIMADGHRFSTRFKACTSMYAFVRKKWK